MGVHGLGCLGVVGLPGRRGHRGRESCKGEPSAAPVPRGQPAPPGAPARLQGRWTELAWEAGKEERREGGAAAPLSRRVIALLRSLSRQSRLFSGRVAASLRNSVSQSCISGANSFYPYLPVIAHVITIAFHFSIACGNSEMPL